eukprot:11004372-Lingulodinium_polyedra.AAC.1
MRGTRCVLHRAVWYGNVDHAILQVEHAQPCVRALVPSAFATVLEIDLSVLPCVKALNPTLEL